MLGNDRMETATTEVTSIRCRNDIENPRGKLIDVLWIVKVECTSKFPRQIDVIISTWICLTNLLETWRTSHVEFGRQMDDEYTKMCPLESYIGSEEDVFSKTKEKNTILKLS